MKKYIALIATFFFTYKSFAQYNYPPTKTADSSHTYFGVTYKDPYQWLENLKDSQVVAWFKRQANFSDSILYKISGRDELIAEWKMLDGLQQPDFVPGLSGERWKYEIGRIFAKKVNPGENVSKLYYREGEEGKDQLLFDPTDYNKGKTLTITNYLPSYDGKKIVIALTELGKEVSDLRIMDVDTRTFLVETIHSSYGANSWTFDNNEFLYSSFNSSDVTNPAFKLNRKTRLHRLGDDVKNDVDFFSDSSYRNLGIRPNEWADASLDENSKNYIFAELNTVQKEKLMYYSPIYQFHSGKIAWKMLCKPGDKIVRSILFIGDDVYAITSKNAKNYKLIHTSLLYPNWNEAEVIMEEKQGLTLEYIEHSKDFLFLKYSDGINSHIFKYDFTKKKIEEVKLPYQGSAFISCMNKSTNTCLIALTSWNNPITEFSYDAETNNFSPSSFSKPPVYPAIYKDLEVEEVEVKGHDGAMIPLSIIHKKGLNRNSMNTCLMYGYGAYGTNSSPSFYKNLNSLAIKGVVIAIAHVRGGSERGETWYKGGYKATKPNTWKDFNSCAEYLIAKGYTSPNKLAGMGTSAGGILISRAITERPDLYSAAICNVGCANAMRLEFSPNGPGNIPEFGTVQDSIECSALYEMDGVQHVIKGTRYPAVI